MVMLMEEQILNTTDRKCTNNILVNNINGKTQRKRKGKKQLKKKKYAKPVEI